MPGRRRQKRTEASKIDATPPWETRHREEPDETTGPYDERDAPDDEVSRVDLGALLIPAGDGYDVRVDINEEQQVIAATLASTEGTMQIGVFAAPRNEGIWDEVRAEIAESLNAQRKASAAEQDGPFGPELHGNVPEDGGKGLVPVRFIGVDGPRWFLRAMFAGPVAADPAKARAFEDALRGIVVVRGSDPLPVREPVPLQLPAGVELPGSEDTPG
ncbi:MAG: hypothetical protein JWR06_3004 [Jatrophihabitans sp.]|nr:hypothetical protein [Jatrophihabitans sp.]MDT4900853.1 hypothetical protein [Pseudonocardiales bacterium]MCW2658811.1 hypothetical protein [Jatrophihabitans sp.]MDT4904041.1 hypothetical protein [Pseudonocardiales bacterium]MDT4930943.1 hypothetical protein [Pseudonocardiales bacterium]